MDGVEQTVSLCSHDMGFVAHVKIPHQKGWTNRMIIWEERYFIYSSMMSTIEKKIFTEAILLPWE